MSLGSGTPRAVHARVLPLFRVVRLTIYRFVYRRPRLRMLLGRVRIALWTAYATAHWSAHVLVTRLAPPRPPR
ncbi:MAG: hypothetical protein WA005_02335, partial [Candidatus Binataceae bacterium]